MVKLIDLPREVLEIIFESLKAPEIKNITQCCTTFKEIVQNSDKLTRQLALRMRFPLDIKKFSDVILSSERKYRVLRIVKSRDCCHSERNPEHNENRHFARLFQKLGDTVQELEVDWSYAMRPREASMFELVQIGRSRRRERLAGEAIENAAAVQALRVMRDMMFTDFMRMMRRFGQLRKLTLLSVHLDRGLQADEQPLDFPQLKELILKHSDAFCFDVLSPSTSLQTLQVSEPWWNNRNPGIETFESFLISQQNLKHLWLKNIQYPRLFQTNRAQQINFKLESLHLDDCNFSHYENAVNFLQTQTDLKHLSIQIQNEKVRMLESLNWYNNILKAVVATPLETLSIEKNWYKFENLEFLPRSRNPHLKKLEYKTSNDDDAELFKIFLQIYPNLQEIKFEAEEKEDTESVVCFDDGTVLDKVIKLSIKNFSATSLDNVTATSLVDFQFVPGKAGEYIDNPFGLFFHRHRTIKHLTIGSLSERSYFFVSFNLCSLMVNFLNHLESVEIFCHFQEVNKSVKLLSTLPTLNTLTILSEDYQQFTAKTKVECARNELKLINVDYAPKSI